MVPQMAGRIGVLMDSFTQPPRIPEIHDIIDIDKIAAYCAAAQRAYGALRDELQATVVRIEPWLDALTESLENLHEINERPYSNTNDND